MFCRFEETFGVDGRHAPTAGGGDRLPVDVILAIARGEDARKVRPGPLSRDDIAALVPIKLPFENPGVRDMADRDEGSAHAGFRDL